MFLKAADQDYQRDLVLVGGGHSHALVLLRWAMSPLPGVRITLVSESSRSPYSGMLPGLVAGHYREDDVYVDLRKLCRHVGARFISARVSGLDPKAKQLLLGGRPALAYDCLSLNVGATPDLGVEGAAEHSIPVKPIASFWPRWLAIREQLLHSPDPQTLAVVGGGAGSVELAMAMAHALRDCAAEHRVLLVSKATDVVERYPQTMRRWLHGRLAELGVEVHTGFQVAAVAEREIRAADGQTLNTDHVFWCTQAQAADWLRDSGLDVTDNGFVRVTDTLRSLRYDDVFAAGDCAWIEGQPLPRAGVYAVRQARELCDNLQRALSGEALKPYRAQRHFLSLLACGDRDAVGARGPVSIAGRWVWAWKNHIDHRFMARFHELPQLPPPARDSEYSLEPPAMRCGGCGAKVGADVLSQALNALDDQESCALAPRDDAAVIALPDNDTQRLVQSVDALKPLVDDPYLFGRITALHALSDLFAMHATVNSAQANVQLPVMAEALQVRDMQQLLGGVREELERHGAGLVGGHTLEGEGLQLALIVNGFCDDEQLLRKGGARAGDVLVLTKGLGTGSIFSAAMRGAAKAAWVDAALTSMLISNARAAELFAQFQGRAMTDITGFGLLGHLLEMLRMDALGAELKLSALPALPGALDCIGRGYQSTLSPANERSRHGVLLESVSASDPRYRLLFDPQTSGGLLAAIPPDQASACVAALGEEGIPACAVGVVVDGAVRILE